MERGKGRAGSLSLRDSDKGRTLSTRQGQLLAEAARNFPGFSGPLKAVYFQHLGYVSISPQGRASDHLVLLSLSVLHPKKRSFKIPANKTRRRARERVPWATTTEGDELTSHPHCRPDSQTLALVLIPAPPVTRRPAEAFLPQDTSPACSWTGCGRWKTPTAES